MVPRRRLVLGLTLVAVTVAAVTSSALGGPTVVRAEAAITGSGTSYRLTVRNTGDEPILCFGLILAGVQPTSATGPAGVLTRVGTFGGGLVHMQGNAATPVVRARETAAADFRTNVAIPANAGGEIRYSSTCQPGSDQVGRATGPPPPPPPPPAAVCNCQNLTVAASKYSSSQVNTGKAVLNLNLNWTMTCSGPTGRCKGRIDILAPARSDIQVVSPKSRNVTCTGRCLGSRTPSRGTTKMRATSAGDLYFDARAGKSFAFRLRLWCTRGARNVPVGAKRITFAFGSGGFLDKRRSDLNGNGVPDGSA